MELRHLRYFVTLAEERHFGRAAERLHITQSPLSSTIIDLERELGVKLFERDSKHVNLTKAGELLLVKAQEIVHQAVRTRDLARAISDGKAGRLEFGFTGSMLYRGLPEIIRSLSGSHPDIQLSVREMSSQAQADLIRLGRLDAGFVNLARAPMGMDSLLIAEEMLVACVPAGHPLASSSAIDVAQLRRDTFALFSREAAPAYYDHLMALFAAAGFDPLVRFEVGHLINIVTLVAGGMCVAVVPQSITRAQIDGAAFVPLMLNEGDMPSTAFSSKSFLVWNSGTETPGLQALIDTVKALTTGRQPGQQPW